MKREKWMTSTPKSSSYSYILQKVFLNTTGRLAIENYLFT